ncbi:ABC transporter substrate-binding protein [Actinomadura soli]|uniref:ABC transporter substrate-binding protein n=1 Tax=Actinomadura soli TaxID=2508997 RepID=A0A5C4JJH8_9ACTN|nr:ABC transporter substrate-binding protein [Actinomadura soli]TMR06938.1 ABC transporter substrate-binding protein [Actinomadura soli]
MSNVDSRNATDPRTATDGKAPVFGRRDVLSFGALSGGMLALSPFLAACKSDAAPALTPQRGGRLRFAGAGVQSETKNVFNTNSPQEIARNRHLFDWVGYMEGGEPVPYIVESIEPADDVSRWRMRIHKEARFSDGSPVTAADVLFSLRSASDPKIGGGLLSAAAASIDFKASRTVGKDVVELRLTEPLADMDTQIYAGKVYVIKAGSHLSKPESFTVDNVVGSGPYTLADLKVGQSAKLAMNENYWGRGLLGGGPYFSEIEVFNIPDPTARLNALLGGQADLAAKLDYAGAKVNASNSAFSFTKTDRVYANEGCFIMNSRKKPFDDPRVRLAFKLACQREALVKGALLGYGSVANDLQGIGFPDYYGDELPQRAYDPAQAQALLRQAGVAGETVEISVFPGVGTAAAAQIYAEQLGKVGMKARVREITPPELFKNFPTFSNIQVLAVAVPGNQPFATSVAPRSLVSKSTFNVAGWLDRDWDRRLLAARATTDQAKRKKLMFRLQSEFWDDSGWIVWGYQTIVNGTASSVHGVSLAGVEDAPSVRKAWKS